MTKFFIGSVVWTCLLLTLFLDLVISNENYRLPKSVAPEHYKLQLFTELDDKFLFNGSVLITLKCLEKTNSITLNSINLEIPNTKVQLSDKGQPIEINRHTFDPENEFYTIGFNETLTPNNTYELFMEFSGKLNEGLKGYYRSSYLDKKSKTKKWLAITQFESTDARQAFPCFDEPAFKATFEISMAHHKNYTSISNMPLKSSEKIPADPEWVMDHFEESVRMSTYLVAFMVSDFEYKTPPKKFVHDNVEFRIWARRDALNQVDFAANIGPQYLKYFEEYFNISFPLPKQDMVAIPDFEAGAMENWGLITYRETALLFDPAVSTSSNRQRVATVVAHELAHQWFGNLVTMKWWTDLWLNEGFATYMAVRAVNHVNPEWNLLNEESLENRLTVFTLDALVSSHPISVPIGHPREIPQFFDGISYQKGAFILRMINLFLGESVFQAGVTNYLNKFAYKNAEQDDLWEALTMEAYKQGKLENDMTVKEIMDSWTLQTGYPFINVVRDYENNTATITQKRFVKGSLFNRSYNESCWWVPLSYTTAKEFDFNSPEPKSWLKCQQQKLKHALEIPMPGLDEWVLFNIQSSGLYKVNYDIQNWELLINALLEDDHKMIPTMARVQLIDDAFDLAAIGELNYGIPLKLLAYMIRESEYLSWNVALDHLSNLNTMLKRRPNYGLFKEYIMQLISPIYDKVAYELAEKSTDAIKRQVLISSWACKYDIGDCREQSKELFKKWMDSKDPDKTNPIPIDLRGVVYCSAIKTGTEKHWNFLWGRYLKSNVGSEKSSILSSLGCTNEVWLLNRYLDWSLMEDKGIRLQDRLYPFAAVARNDIGYYLAKNFLKANIEQLARDFGPKSSRINRYIKIVAVQMITEDELSELEEFTKRQARFLTGSTLAVEQAIENVKINIEWQNKFYDQINQLLENDLMQKQRSNKITTR